MGSKVQHVRVSEPCWLALQKQELRVYRSFCCGQDSESLKHLFIFYLLVLGQNVILVYRHGRWFGNFISFILLKLCPTNTNRSCIFKLKFGLLHWALEEKPCAARVVSSLTDSPCVFIPQWYSFNNGGHGRCQLLMKTVQERGCLARKLKLMRAVNENGVNLLDISTTILQNECEHTWRCN